MKERILAELKTKYSHLGLSQTVFNGVADLLAKTITEESQIDAVVANSGTMLSGFQTESDRRVNDLNGKVTGLEEQVASLSKPPANPKPTGGDEGEKIPAWAQGIMETVKGLNEAKQQESINQRDTGLRSSAKAIMIEKGINESLCDHILKSKSIGEADTAESLAQGGIEDYNFTKAAFAPEGGVPQTPQGGQVSDEARKKFFADRRKDNELQNKTD